MRSLLLFLIGVLNLPAAERPNILWITSEDNDKLWLGCYGNKQANTPNIDALAQRSIRFENFYSNAPVCAVARSTILTGVHAPSQGTQHMRSRHPIPAANKPYLEYLRAQGYYCTNASKTDFNFQINDKEIWDECGQKAHYRNRSEEQPFFAVFNLTESHESSLFADKIASNRRKGRIPKTPRIDPKDVNLPPHLPDLPEVRQNIAVYHDNLTLMDSRVGALLAELEAQGVADNTIVFYYADHGGITPRGKRYLKNTGVNVPLLVHVPKKWQSLSPYSNGSSTDQPAAFVDLAPTLLSLLDIAKPAQMQGKAFLGKRIQPSKAKDYVFLYADRFDEIYGMRRGLTDGRWKYIRRFTPHYAATPYSYFQFGQSAWVAWRKAWQEGQLQGRHRTIWERHQPVEELFDTQSDPWEVTNLANHPDHTQQLMIMRQALKEKMVTVHDTGLIPEPMFAELAPGTPIATFAKSEKNDWSQLADLAFIASARDEESLPTLITKLSSQNPLERYWGVQGCLILDKKSLPAAESLRKLLTDTHSANRVSAAQALITIGQPTGAYELLLSELHDSKNEYAQQNVINIYTQLDALEKIPDSWVKSSRGRNAGKYIKRLADKLAKERKL